MAKKKINDDKLLQLIRDGNSPAGLEKRISALEENAILRLLLSPAASQKRPHKKSAANCTYVPWLHNANREPERGEGSAANYTNRTLVRSLTANPQRSEGGHSQKIVPGLGHSQKIVPGLGHSQKIVPGLEA